MTAPLPPLGTRVVVATNSHTTRHGCAGRSGTVAALETSCAPTLVEVCFDLGDAVLILPAWCGGWDTTGLHDRSCPCSACKPPSLLWEPGA